MLTKLKKSLKVGAVLSLGIFFILGCIDHAGFLIADAGEDQLINLEDTPDGAVLNGQNSVAPLAETIDIYEWHIGDVIYCPNSVTCKLDIGQILELIPHENTVEGIGSVDFNLTITSSSGERDWDIVQIVLNSGEIGGDYNGPEEN